MTPILLTGPFVMQHPDDPCRWVLTQDYLYREDNVMFIIPKGFVYDFASIPRIFWNIISPAELGDVGPLKHDWKYANKKGTRAAADKQFKTDMKSDGIGWWKRQAAYSAVRAFGWTAWGKSKVVIEELVAA